MRLSLAFDEFGRLACALGDDAEKPTVYAADPPAALADLAAALEETERTGAGECVWLVSMGEYRWVMRRDGARLRLAVMFLRSVAVGYQHVYWGESRFDDFAAGLRDEIARTQAAHA